MKKRIFVFALIWQTAWAENIQTLQSDDQSNNSKVNLTTHSSPRINIATTVNMPEDDLEDCTSFQGQRLKDCMACQTKESFRKNMLKLTDATVLAYLKNLAIDEYVYALSNYNEEQWQEFIESRKKSNQELFPHSLNKQRRCIKLFYIRARHLTPYTYWFSSENTLHADDLEEMIADYEARRDYNKTWFPIWGYKQAMLHQDFDVWKKQFLGNRHK